MEFKEKGFPIEANGIAGTDGAVFGHTQRTPVSASKPAEFDNFSETAYSTSEGTGKDFRYHDMGEDTSEQAQKDNAKLREIFTPRSGSVVANSIKVVNVSGVVRNFADRITTVFGRRAVFYRAAPGAGLPNGLIDRNALLVQPEGVRANRSANQLTADLCPDLLPAGPGSAS